MAEGKRARLSEEARERRERGYLQHILVYLASGETSASFFRTLVDNWYAYHRGAAFRTATGSPHWFNAVKPKDLGKLGPALNEMDFISVDAAAILDAGTGGVLIKDHAIPIKLLRDRMLADRPRTESDVRDFLLAWYRVGVITDEEHDRLKARRCNDCMPDGWDGQLRFARYDDASIPRGRGRFPLDGKGRHRESCL